MFTYLSRSDNRDSTDREVVILFLPDSLKYTFFWRRRTSFPSWFRSIALSNTVKLLVHNKQSQIRNLEQGATLRFLAWNKPQNKLKTIQLSLPDASVVSVLKKPRRNLLVANRLSCLIELGFLKMLRDCWDIVKNDHDQLTKRTSVTSWASFIAGNY